MVVRGSRVTTCRNMWDISGRGVNGLSMQKMRDSPLQEIMRDSPFWLGMGGSLLKNR